MPEDEKAKKGIVNYVAMDGNSIELTPDIVKGALVKGNSNMSYREIFMFMKLCEARKLNPFIGDAYPVKYGEADAQIITSKDYWLKKIKSCEGYEWHKAGIIILKQGKDGPEIERPVGTFFLPDIQQLVGGWAVVCINGELREHSVTFSEYNSGKSTWKSIPATMIRKVALAQLVREILPEETAGLYDESEVIMRDATPGNKDIGIAGVREKIKEALSGKSGEKVFSKKADELTDIDALNSLLASVSKLDDAIKEGEDLLNE